MSEGKTNNINIGGGTIGGLQIGDGNSQSITQNFGDREATVPAVFAAVKESLKELPETHREEFEEQVIQPLQALANLPIAQQQEPTAMETAEALLARIKPFAGVIGKGLMAFGEASLTALASGNPIVAGLIATTKVVQAGMA